MKRFLSNYKLLIGLVLISFIVLGIGFMMLANKPAVDARQDIKDLAKMEALATYAQQQLESTRSTSGSPTQLEDIKPASSLERVAALKGRVPELGSDDWCEVMMVKDADAWTQDERSLFAEKCI